MVATIIAKFMSPRAINRAIKDSLVIVGRHFKPELMETEPMRCLNCQLYGHLAADCKNLETCANCRHAHRTERCTVRNEPSRYRCVNCKVVEHAIHWDRIHIFLLGKCQGNVKETTTCIGIFSHKLFQGNPM